MVLKLLSGQSRAKLFSFMAISFVIMLLASWFGILTRPLSYSAFFWPANAILLGMFMRYPHMCHPATLFGAFAGFMLADFTTGTYVVLSLVMTSANLISVLSCFYICNYLISMIKKEELENSTQASYPYLISTLSGSFLSAVFASAILPHVPHTFLSADQPILNLISWWSGELFNYVLLVPILISFPSWEKIGQRIHAIAKSHLQLSDLQHVLPLSAVIFSCVLTHYFFAPGALLYPLATLMWAATYYSLFNMSVMTTIVVLTMYHSLSLQYMHNVDTNFLYPMFSVRIGLIILAITTLYICIMNINRRRIFKEVEYLADHDSLTEALNRRSFIKHAQKSLGREKNYPISILMLDMDHFKKLNDNYGHQAGDLALKHFAAIVRNNLRLDDLFCRIGGEEFVLMIRQTEMLDVLSIAERIRENVEITPFEHNGEKIALSVSIGIRHISELHPEIQLEHLLRDADEALYAAKQHGRNQVRIYMSDEKAEPALEMS